MRKFYILVLLAFSPFIFGQIGMGTPTPRGILDINRPLTNTFGLVLPTNSNTANIVNPQGGAVAPGTMMYDSSLKRVKVYTGGSWSDCIVSAPPSSSAALSCSGAKFNGNFISSKPLTNQTFEVTITNNSSASVGPVYFYDTDLALSGINGVSVTSVTPASVTLTAGQSQTITYTLSGAPEIYGILTGSWSKVNLSCANTVTVGIAIRFANYGYYAIGGNEYSTFNSQLTNAVNYGPTGTYSGNFTGFQFTNITATLSNLSVADLLDKYDIISFSAYQSMSVTDIAKIKAYTDQGGVAIIGLYHDNRYSTAIFQGFGGTGSADQRSRIRDISVTNNAINSGVFGNVPSGSRISNYNSSVGSQDFTCLIYSNQLPPGAVSIIANNSSTVPEIFTTGNDNRAIFFSGVFYFHDDYYGRNSNQRVRGSTIDTTQEKFLHNIMAYALQKAGF